MNQTIDLIDGFEKPVQIRELRFARIRRFHLNSAANKSRFLSLLDDSLYKLYANRTLWRLNWLHSLPLVEAICILHFRTWKKLFTDDVLRSKNQFITVTKLTPTAHAERVLNTIISVERYLILFRSLFSTDGTRPAMMRPIRETESFVNMDALFVMLFLADRNPFLFFF